jgi:trehalose synthase-fused probable maltokinase
MADPSHTPSRVDLADIAGSWSWSRWQDAEIQVALQRALVGRVPIRRWFGAKARTIVDARLMDSCLLPGDVCLALVEFRFAEGPADVYQLPLAIATNEEPERLAEFAAEHEWARFSFLSPPRDVIIYDALASRVGRDALLNAFRSTGAATSTAGGDLVVVPGPASKQLIEAPREPLDSWMSAAEQSNTSVRYGQRLILKVYRRIEPGVHPDWEVNSELARQHYPYIPPLVAALEYRRAGQPAWTLALLQGFVSNHGDGWECMLKQLGARLSQVRVDRDAPIIARFDDDVCAASTRAVPAEVEHAMGDSLEAARQLGECTALMHLALERATTDPAFQPEAITAVARASAVLEETLDLLERQRPQLAAETAAAAEVLLGSRDQLASRQRRLAEVPIHLMTIRIHGDFHLGQVLMTDEGPVVIDFEGEPSRSLRERREKQIALRDVAGMIRSFHYASCAAAADARDSCDRQTIAAVDACARAWYYWTSACYLRAYRDRADGAAFLPAEEQELRALLSACILDKAIYELRYELNNRPDWVHLPLGALVEVVAGTGTR